MTAKFVVKGSNESRPRVQLGDLVRVRPAENDMLRIFQQKGIQLAMFELCGVVISYTLASEEVICEFPIPSPSIIIQMQQYNEYFSIDQMLELCSDLKYNIRYLLLLLLSDISFQFITYIYKYYCNGHIIGSHLKDVDLPSFMKQYKT